MMKEGSQSQDLPEFERLSAYSGPTYRRTAPRARPFPFSSAVIPSLSCPLRVSLASRGGEGEGLTEALGPEREDGFLDSMG
jgi:hypothetical protein